MVRNRCHQAAIARGQCRVKSLLLARSNLVVGQVGFGGRVGEPFTTSRAAGESRRNTNL
jgi:hypothetical protein